MAKHESIEHRIENGQMVSEIDGWWEVVTKEKQADGSDQTVVTRVNKHSTKVRPIPEPIDPTMFTRRAPSTVIRPTKRQKPTRDSELLIGLGDIHFPFEDQRALGLAHLAIRELFPDTVVCLGDNQDLAMFSRFERRQDWIGSTQEGLDREHAMWTQIIADTREARLLRVQGNHDIRLERELRNVNGELLGLRRANAQSELGVLTLGYLLRLEELGVEQLDGYPNAEYWINDNLKIMHGRATSPTGKASHVNVNKEDVSTLSGHDHSMSIARRTIPTRDGSREIFAFNAGTLATIDGTTLPSQRLSTTERGNQIARHHNWQQGVAVVFHDEETARPYWLPIDQNGIDIFGKVYSS